MKIKPTDNYTELPLQQNDLPPHPMTQFGRWFEEMKDTEEAMPEAMSVATVSSEGIPSTRMVLCKSFDENGFVFYTNYDSAKARQLDNNPNAALLFHWKSLARQVRVVGCVERVSRDVTEAYFSSRVRGSQLSAWASPQSACISQEEMHAQYKAMEDRFAGQDIPTPPNWGGYRVKPTSIEFWQGRDNRFHDRFQYQQSNDGWSITRLAP